MPKIQHPKKSCQKIMLGMLLVALPIQKEEVSVPRAENDAR
jgi:hypothetical protein